MASFLNTVQWLEFQKSVGRKGWRFDDGKISFNVIRHDLPFRKNYLYVPHGPHIEMAKILGGFRNEVAVAQMYLLRLAKENYSVFIKMEPMNNAVPELLRAGGVWFKYSKTTVQPKKTVILDITQNEDELLSAMHHKTRYNIKVAQGHGIIVQQGRDIQVFLELMRKTSKRDKFHPHPAEYYKKLIELGEPASPDASRGGPLKTGLFLAYYGDKPVAGAIVLIHGDTGYYLHGASDNTFRQLMAPHLLHWSIIKNLREQGIKFYDLWGIDANRWPGVTRFKLGLGGRQVEHPGAFDIPIRKFWYWLYKLRQRFKK